MCNCLYGQGDVYLTDVYLFALEGVSSSSALKQVKSWGQREIL